MAKKKLTSKELYDFLKPNLIGKKGVITFSLSGLAVDIESTDIVGNSIQSWLGKYLESNNIFFTTKSNTQEFPDFILDDEDEENSLLEVKAFNYDASPAFDIANFDSYCFSLKEKAYRLNANYLIIGYSMNGATIEIRDIWLKKIWEISSFSKRRPLRVQAKKGIIYNIRPCKWYAKRSAPFAKKEEFVNAIYETLSTYEHSSIDSDEWLEEVMENYESYTGCKLDLDV